MNSSNDIGLPEALERAAAALPGDEEKIRPANGDPFALLSLLDAEASQRVLEWLLANEPLAGSELVEAWADAGGEAVALLTRIDGSGLSKQARKALRRAHHRMRSRGESIPDRVEQPIVATLPKVVDEFAVSLISGLDPRGTRMAYIVENDPSGGARLVRRGDRRRPRRPRTRGLQRGSEQDQGVHPRLHPERRVSGRRSPS